MRTEKEVREYRDALVKLVDRPCDCDKRSLFHSYQCRVGGAMMRSSIRTLSWLLGEADDPRVEQLVKAAADADRGQ